MEYSLSHRSLIYDTIFFYYTLYYTDVSRALQYRAFFSLLKIVTTCI